LSGIDEFPTLSLRDASFYESELRIPNLQLVGQRLGRAYRNAHRLAATFIALERGSVLGVPAHRTDWTSLDAIAASGAILEIDHDDLSL